MSGGSPTLVRPHIGNNIQIITYLEVGPSPQVTDLRLKLNQGVPL